jgi:hypothetical protein
MHLVQSDLLHSKRRASTMQLLLTSNYSSCPTFIRKAP